MKRKTKIVCTIGPATDSPEVFENLLKAGMDVARLNFSHENHESHAARIKRIREISKRIDKPVTLLQDLSGPKIRIGDIKDKKILLEKGDIFLLTTKENANGADKIALNYPSIIKDIKEGEDILMADGSISLKAIEVKKEGIVCQVQNGDWLSSHKGVNFPSTKLKIPALTEKDKMDLEFGVKSGVDLMALSFVKNGDDVLQMKKLLVGLKSNIPVIAKIEKGEAIIHIDEILNIADGIMVARGDLGVEIPLYKVPITQKILISKARYLGKPVITATQMLKSMVDTPMPTRAEASDVANAIWDGTDAVMLSEETAIGKFPCKAVEFMNNIAIETEQHAKFPDIKPEHRPYAHVIPNAISHTACIIAKDMDAKIIITPTLSGNTAVKVSRFRPGQPVIAITPDKNTFLQLKLVWGVYPYLIDNLPDINDVINTSIEMVKKDGWVKKDDKVVITAGSKLGSSTNMIQAVCI